MEKEKTLNSMKTQRGFLLPEDQITLLHQQMMENRASYRQKLQSSQEAQHRQAILVQKLQAKVLQYRNWCKELEKRLESNSDSHPHLRNHKVEQSIENVLVHLEEEQQRCENLVRVNILLRKHLDKANEVNEALQEDINKLTDDWTRAKTELEHKESEWHKERELFEHYRQSEHDRILGIWRQVVKLRRHFLEMKTATDRDLSELKAEQVRVYGSILISCFHVSSDAQFWETKNLEDSALKCQERQQSAKKLEKEKYQQAKANGASHVKGDFAKEDLQSRVLELTALLEESHKQNEEKEKTVKSLRETIEIQKANNLKIDCDQTPSKDISKEIFSLQHVLTEITQALIIENDAIIGIRQIEQYADPCGIMEPNTGDSDGTFLLLRDVLARRRNQVEQLRRQLVESQESATALEKHQKQQEEQCSFLRDRLEKLEGERDTYANQLQHLQSVLETCRSDNETLEKSRRELQQQLEILEQEAQHLRQSNTELQLKGDMADGEKEEKQGELERLMREREYIQEDQNALEEKHSLLKNELITMRESLEKSHLDGELMKQEKYELASALEQAEESLAKLTSVHNRLKAETANLHDTVTKMSALNEALALDKVSLNQLVLKLEQENQTLLGKVDHMERRGASLQKQLNQTERTNEELNAEKFRLEELLHKAEELQESLQNELRVLTGEKEEANEKLSQVHHQNEIYHTSLEQANQELIHTGEMLSQASREKESLMREKTSLEVRLKVVERDRLTLTEQMSKFRSGKDLLESNLFQAQQQLSQLEVTRDQLEMKIQAISQAKEVIQGEVKCLRAELEAAKLKVEQEKEEKAQQLSQIEQKYQETLSHCYTVHKEEMDTLCQKLENERGCHQIKLECVVKEKEETENVCERKLLELQQKITDIQTHMEDELIKAENAKQEALLEKENEKKLLREEIFQTNEKLANTSQQLECLHQEMKKLEEREQSNVQLLEAKLKDSTHTVKTLKIKQKEEIKSLKEEINILLNQRDSLQNQIQELEFQLLASKDSCKLFNQEAQQHLREKKELSEQKELEVSQLQKLLETERKQREEVIQQNIKWQKQKEELEQRNTELTAMLQSQWETEKHLNKKLLGKQEEVERQRTTIQALERKQGQWEKAELQNSELQRQWEEAKVQIKLLQNQKRDTELQNRNLRQQKEEVELKNTKLKAVFQRHQEEAEHESALLQSHWEEAQKRCSELQNWKEKVEYQNAEFQALLHNKQEEMESKDTCMKKEQNLNLQLKATLQALEHERAGLILSLEEKEFRLKKLQEKDDTHQDEITKLNSALHQAEKMIAELKHEVQEFINQMESLKQMMVQKEATLIAREEELTQDLEVSRANEQHAKDTIQKLEAEMSQLRLSLCSTESRAEALASECQRVCSVHWEAQAQLVKLHSVLQYMLCNSPEPKLRRHADQNFWSSSFLNREQDNLKELALSPPKDSSTELTAERVAEALQQLRQDLWQAHLERDEARKNSEKLKQELTEKETERLRINAKAEELQKWLTQCQEEKNVVEGRRSSLESALKLEVIAFKEENVSLREKLTSLEMKLENTEKQRKGLVNEQGTLQKTKEKLTRELELLQESVKTSELRARAMEKMNETLEQELQTALSTLRNKHEEVETHLKRLVALQKEVEVGRALQETVDQLNITVKKKHEEIKDQLQQIRDLENHKEMQKAALEHLTKNLENRSKEIDFQKMQIEELTKQDKMQKADLKKLNLDLEEAVQTLKSQQEKVQKLQELSEDQKTIIESLSLNLEEKIKEANIKEEKIQIMECNESTQIGVLLKDLDDMKIKMNEKGWELASQKQLLQEWEEQGEKREKALCTSLEHMKAIIKDKERKIESQREQISVFQQLEAQKEEHLSELSEKQRQMTLTLTQREQELKAQKNQIKEMKEEMEIKQMAFHEHIAKTQATLEENNRELAFQRKHEEESKSQIRLLLEDIHYSSGLLKETEGNAEFPDEQINQQKKQKLQETTSEMLGQLKVFFKRQQQEIESLKEQHEKNTQENVKLIKGLQAELQQAKQALKTGELQIKYLKEKNLQQVQQQETRIKFILDKLHLSRSSLHDKEKETKSLQMCIKELSKQKEEVQHTVLSLQQDLDRINRLNAEKEEELRKQGEQVSKYQAKVEATQREQKSKEELLQYQDKNEQDREKHPREQEKLFDKKTKEINCQDEISQKPMKDEPEGKQKHHQLIKKKDVENELQKGKIEQLEKRLKDKEKELLTYSDQIKQIISALRVQDNKEHNFHSCIEKIFMWKEKELAQRKVIKEKEQCLKWQKEKIEHLENEKVINRQELNRMIAVLKQTESGEIEWRQKAQKLDLTLARSEKALRILKEEMAVIQTMVSERDMDRLHLQEQLDTAFKTLKEARFIIETLVGVTDVLSSENDIPEALKKEGQLTWMAEKQLLYRRLQLLQQAVASLENDKHGLEKRNVQLRDALQEVEHERRKLKRSHGDFSLTSEYSQADSVSQKILSISKKETQVFQKQLAELQKQVFVLQSQLSLERKQKQNYIISYTKTNQELSDLHQELVNSLAVVARKPEAAVLESETRKLDETLNNSLTLRTVVSDSVLSGKQLASSTPKSVHQKPTR